MAARSFSITIDNLTGVAWDRVGLGLDHGEWSNNGASVPPEHIPESYRDMYGHTVGTVITFGNESDGFATGAEGHVDYQNSLGLGLHISWDNPFIGSNSFSATTDQPYQISYGDIGGNNANVTVQIN